MNVIDARLHGALLYQKCELLYFFLLYDLNMALEQRWDLRPNESIYNKNFEILIRIKVHETQGYSYW